APRRHARAHPPDPQPGVREAAREPGRRGAGRLLGRPVTVHPDGNEPGRSVRALRPCPFSSPHEARGPTMTTPVERIRSHFPALSRTHAGEPVAFFDGAAGSQVPQPVIDAVADYLAHRNANTHGVF